MHTGGGRAETTVQVVSALMDAIQRGDMRAIQFWLKTQAGWSEKHQLEIAKAEQGDSAEDRHWTFEVMGEKPERLPPREINFVRTGMNADGTKYQFFYRRGRQLNHHRPRWNGVSRQ